MEAMTATHDEWGEPPVDGWVTSVDTRHVASANPGYCFKQAGWWIDRDVQARPTAPLPRQAPRMTRRTDTEATAKLVADLIAVAKDAEEIIASSRFLTWMESRWPRVTRRAAMKVATKRRFDDA